MTTLLTYLLVGIVAVTVIGVVLSVVGVALGLTLKLLPVIAIGYIAVRLLKPKQKRLSAEDRKWLES